MKKSFLGMAIPCLIAGLTLSGCKKDGSVGEGTSLSVVTMTTTDAPGLLLIGYGAAIVDWGDGNSERVTLGSELNYLVNGTFWPHYYSASGSHTIKITGIVTGMHCLGKLTSLDVSKNAELMYLLCSYGQLTALDISKNTALTYLECSYNPLTALDVSKNIALRYLECSGNKLTTLDVSKNTALTGLNCEWNQLTALDVSKNTALTSLYCPNNQLTAGALNILFGTLHGNTIPDKSKEINISYNPGADGCNKTIATQKGWTVK